MHYIIMLKIADIHIIEGTDKSIIYHIPTNTILKVDSSVAKQFYSELSYDKECDISENTKLIIQKIQQNEFLGTSHSSWMETHVLGKLTLVVATRCNLRCKYCYAEGGVYSGYDEQLLTAEEGKDIIDYYLAKGVKLIKTIMFFGGEPLLALESINEICNYVEQLVKNRKLEIIPSFKIVTNLTHIPKNFETVLNMHNIQLTVSIDGPKKIHDLQRVDMCNCGTFDEVSKNILRYKKYIAALESTYTMNHIHFGMSLNDTRIWLANTFGFQLSSVFVVPVMNMQNLEVNRKEYAKSLETSELTEEDYVVASAFNPKAQSDLFCQAGYSTACVMPNGDVYPCHMYANFPNYCLGNIFYDTRYSLKTIKEKLPISKNKLDRCKKCWARKFCRICLAKIPYTDKTVEGYLNDQLCADLCYDYEQVFKKLSGI